MQAAMPARPKVVTTPVVVFACRSGAFTALHRRPALCLDSQQQGVVGNRGSAQRSSMRSKVRLRTFTDDVKENVLAESLRGEFTTQSVEEYPSSVWALKPMWCQPWSILSTGCAFVGFSWVIAHNVVVSALAAAPIAAWWYLFLVLYPASYVESVAALKAQQRQPNDGI